MTTVKVAFCVAGALLGVNAFATGPSFVWPESGTATIPKGTTVVVTDADYDRVNALDGITIEKGATNVFQTSKAPTTLLSGYGAWVKRGDAHWTVSTIQKTFYGSFIIEEGVVTNAMANAKGWPWTYDEDTYEFVVREGAMFVNAATDEGVSFGPHRIRIAGTGVNGEGAIVHLAGRNFTFCKLKLDGDAKIVSRNSNGAFFLGPYSSTHGRCELFGHTLTVETATSLSMCRNELVGDQGGLIRIASGNLAFASEAGYDNPFLCVEPNAGAFSMAKSGTIFIKRDVPNIEVPLTIESGADVMIKHIHESYASDCCFNADSNSWAGAVTIEKNAILRMRTDRSKGGRHFRISGRISGAGSLDVP